MLTKTVIGKKSDAHDSKESSRFANRLNDKNVIKRRILLLNKMLQNCANRISINRIMKSEVWNIKVHPNASMGVKGLIKD